MKSLFNRSIAVLLSMLMPVMTALAAVGEGGALAPEPTVGIGWVFTFFVLFVGICVWIGIAIYRAERKSKAAQQQDVAKS